MQHKMPMVCIENVHVHLRIHIYIRRGLQCCCLDVKAIPEPYEAEQQDCSPAFLFYIKSGTQPTGSRFFVRGGERLVQYDQK